MQYQMDFWPAARKAPYEQTPWASLSSEEQAALHVRLARLIAKAVCPELIKNIEEKHHEPSRED